MKLSPVDLIVLLVYLIGRQFVDRILDSVMVRARWPDLLNGMNVVDNLGEFIGVVEEAVVEGMILDSVTLRDEEGDTVVVEVRKIRTIGDWIELAVGGRGALRRRLILQWTDEEHGHADPDHRAHDEQDAPGSGRQGRDGQQSQRDDEGDEVGEELPHEGVHSRAPRTRAPH